MSRHAASRELVCKKAATIHVGEESEGAQAGLPLTSDSGWPRDGQICCCCLQLNPECNFSPFKQQILVSLLTKITRCWMINLYSVF